MSKWLTATWEDQYQEQEENMTAVVLMVLLGIGAIVALILRRKYKKKDSSLGSKICAGVAGLLALVVLIIGLSSTLYSQDPGEAKVLQSFTGEVVGSDPEAGIGLKAPWVKAIDYDIRNNVIKFEGNGENVEGPAITAQDKDGATATFNVTIEYSIESAYVEEIYKNYGSQDQLESRLIKTQIDNAARLIPAQYNTGNFRNSRDAAQDKLKVALTENTKLKDSGIVVNVALIGDIKYPQGIEDSLQKVQEATNEANGAKAKLETAKVEAEKTRVDAQAQADADQITRCGATTVQSTEVINGVETKVTKVIPIGNDRCQNRLNEQVLTNKWIDAMKEIAGKDGNVIVVPENGNPPIIQVPQRQK